MPVEELLRGRATDVGGLTVTRLLPQAKRRSIGPFVFVDHMGPAMLQPESGLDVRPHPHIGLATVTYLFADAIEHRDSLGCVQRIEPGDVNWMTAGRGIVHSERLPRDRADARCRCMACRPGSHCHWSPRTPSRRSCTWAPTGCR
jgi:redox-sensitive bicupin YhaK (pirin superfamily)